MNEQNLNSQEAGGTANADILTGPAYAGTPSGTVRPEAGLPTPFVAGLQAWDPDNWKPRLHEAAGLLLLPCGYCRDPKTGKESYKSPIDPAGPEGRGLGKWTTARFTPDQILGMKDLVRCVGTRLGPDSGGLICLDLDGASAVAEVIRRGCSVGDTWTIWRNTDPNRLKVIFRLPPAAQELLAKSNPKGKPKGKGALPTGEKEQIECFWTSGQVVIIGEHVDSGGFYFWHQSPAGVLTLTQDNPWWRLIWEILVPEPEQRPQPQSAVTSSSSSRGGPSSTGPVELHKLLSREQEQLWSQGAGEGGRNNAAFALAVGLICAHEGAAMAGLPVVGDPERELLQFALRCSPPLDEGEALGVLASAQKEARTPDRGLTERIGFQKLGKDCWWHAARLRQDGLSEDQILQTMAAWGAPPEARPQLSTAEKLAHLEALAAQLLEDRAPYATRLPMLRAEAETVGIRMRDSELLAMLTAARRLRIQGEDDPFLRPGDALDMTPAPWIWEGLLLRGTLNLVVALPKQGKTSLLVAMIGAWNRNEPALLDRPLWGLCPPVLIVGPDQGQEDWGHMLQGAGLADAQGRIGGPIIGLAHAGRPVYLDPEGIDRIAAYAQRHPGLLVLIDSLSRCIAPLGLREESPEVAMPVAELMEQLEPHKATVVLIHHASKGRAGESASSASRGSTALPAMASQVIKLGPANPGNDNDRRRVITTEGRLGQPQAMVIEREGATWNLLGGLDQLQREQDLAGVERKLSERQTDVLRLVRERWEDHSRRTTVADVVAEGIATGKNADDLARKALQTLEKRGLLQSVGKLVEGRGSRLYEFWPAAPEGGNRPPQTPGTPNSPETPSVGSVGSAVTLAHEDPERNDPPKSQSQQATDPTDPTDPLFRELGNGAEIGPKNGSVGPFLAPSEGLRFLAPQPTDQPTRGVPPPLALWWMCSALRPAPGCLAGPWKARRPPMGWCRSGRRWSGSRYPWSG